jgi:hypothetical protein
MKRTFLVSIIVLCLVSAAFAQRAEIGQGSKAVCFTFNGLSNLGLGTIQGGIGFKQWISNDKAVMPTFLFGLNSTSNQAPTGMTSDKNSELTLGLRVNLEIHKPLSNSISPYFGFGIGYRTGSTTHKPSIPTSNPTAGITSETKNTTSTFVVGGLLGVEFFIRKNISLSGHYTFDFESGSNTQKTTLVSGAGIVQPPDGKTSTTVLGFSTTSVILSLYL